jgi:hypothetical protein
MRYSQETHTLTNKIKIAPESVSMKLDMTGIIVQLMDELNLVPCSFNGTFTFHDERIEIYHISRKMIFRKENSPPPSSSSDSKPLACFGYTG